MDTRIYNTLFNGLSSNTPNGEKPAFLVTALSQYNGGTYRIYNSLYPNLYDSNITLATQEVLYNYLLNKSQMTFYFDLSANRNLFWGEDSGNFAAEVISAFNLTDSIPEITDTITVNFSFVTTPISPPTALPNNVYLGSNDTTFNNVSFENLAGGGASYRAILFNIGDIPLTVTVSIKATDFTPGDEKLEITWNN